MVDLFEEVEDQLRVEHYKQLGMKFLPWAIGIVLVVLVVGGGLIGYSVWNDNRMGQSAQNYDKALDTLQKGDSEGAFAAFAEIAQKGVPIYKSFALTQQAAIRLGQGKDQDAAALFTQSADAAPKTPEGLIFADFARLKSAWSVLDVAPYADLEKRLKPLTDSKRPYSTAAREALAWAKLRAGMVDAAKADFTGLQTAVDAPQSQVQEAQEALALIASGGAPQLQKTIEAIKALPPPAPQSQMSPEMLQQLMSQAGQGQGAPPK